MKNLLLLSNTSSFKHGFLGHCEREIKDFLGESNELLFIPYAKKDYELYFTKAEPFFRKIGVKLNSIHKTNPHDALENAKAMYIPGGNTFRLLKEIYSQEILDLIKERVELGTKYIGSSAGSAIASPTIRTTNDMPIIEPPSFDSLNLIPFQLNCHYLDKDPNFPHNGESREMRIWEFHEEDDIPVIGLREDTWLEVSDSEVVLRGEDSAVLFRSDEERQEIEPNAKISL